MLSGNTWSKIQINLAKKLITAGKNNNYIMDMLWNCDPGAYVSDHSAARLITKIKKQGYGVLGNRSGKKAIPAKNVEKPCKGYYAGLVSDAPRRGRGRPRTVFNNLDPEIHSLFCHIVKTIGKIKGEKHV